MSLSGKGVRKEGNAARSIKTRAAKRLWGDGAGVSLGDKKKLKESGLLAKGGHPDKTRRTALRAFPKGFHRVKVGKVFLGENGEILISVDLTRSDANLCDAVGEWFERLDHGIDPWVSVSILRNSNFPIQSVFPLLKIVKFLNIETVNGGKS